MTREEIRILFDRALELGDGEQIRIKCSSKSQMETVRTYLYQQRRRFSELSEDLSIRISREISKDGFFVTISRNTEPFSNVEIIRKDGVERIDLTSTPEETPNEERIRELMKKDGFTDEDIDMLLSEKASEG